MFLQSSVKALTCDWWWRRCDVDSFVTTTASCWTSYNWTKVSAKVTKNSSSGCCGIRRRKRSVVSRSGNWRFATWTFATEASAKLCEYDVVSHITYIREQCRRSLILAPSFFSIIGYWSIKLGRALAGRRNYVAQIVAYTSGRQPSQLV